MGSITIESVKAEVLRIAKKIGKPNLTIRDYTKEAQHTWTAAGRTTLLTFNQVKLLCGLPCNLKRKPIKARAGKAPKYSEKKCLKCEGKRVRPGYRVCDSCQEQNNRAGDAGIYMLISE